MKAHSIEQFTRYSLNSILTQFFILLLSVATSIITARSLGPEGKGQLTLILLIPWLAITVGRMGISHAVNYYANKTSPTKLIVNSFILSVPLSALLVAVSLPIIFALKDVFFRTISDRLIIIISLFIPIYLFNTHFISLIQGLYKINLRNLLLVSQSALNLMLLIILILILKLGVNGAVIASMIAISFIFFSSVLSLLKDINVKEINLDFGLMRQLLNFGFKSHIGNILKDFSYRGDILIISYFLLPAYVGYYVVAVAVAEIIWKIPEAVGSVILPYVASIDKNDAKFFTPKVCRRMCLIMVIICLIIVALSKKIVIFAFGVQFYPSVSALIFLIPGILSFSIWKILANDLIAQGYPAQYSMTSALALVTMIIMDLILIPIFGINGAAIASSISYIAATIFIIFLYIKITKNTVKSLLIPLKSDFIFYKNIITNLVNLKFKLSSIMNK